MIEPRASRLAAEPAALAGLGRHVYDVYCLLRAAEVRRAISVPGVVSALAADAEAHSRRHGFPSTPRPEAGFAASPAWVDTGDVRRTMAAVYAATRELVWGPFPALEEWVAEVQAMGAHL